MSKVYSINECFYSLQGEGTRAGEPSVFLRFAGCNLNCNKAEHGFDCDTDFRKLIKMRCEEVVDLVKETARDCKWVVLTGGEPALQVNASLARALKEEGFKLAIETNGLRMLDCNGYLDWICVSPKTPPRTIMQVNAHEVKFVVKAGDPIPKTNVEAKHYLLSPAYEVEDKLDPANPGHLTSANLQHAIQLCLDNPKWRLSEQQHKRWLLR